MDLHLPLSPVDGWVEPHPIDVPALRRRTGALLRSGVPLTLLLDLADPHGPDSPGRFANEGCDTGWLRDVS